MSRSLWTAKELFGPLIRGEERVGGNPVRPRAVTGESPPLQSFKDVHVRLVYEESRGVVGVVNFYD